ncbi:hypothetical protein [Ancylothrix sp. D3o]|nr:hypothetical protein [Ancylothrix sp. D3o]
MSAWSVGAVICPGLFGYVGYEIGRCPPGLPMFAWDAGNLYFA